MSTRLGDSRQPGGAVVPVTAEIREPRNRYAGPSAHILLTKARPVTKAKSESGKSPLLFVEGLQSYKGTRRRKELGSIT